MTCPGCRAAQPHSRGGTHVQLRELTSGFGPNYSRFCRRGTCESWSLQLAADDSYVRTPLADCVNRLRTSRRQIAGSVAGLSRFELIPASKPDWLCT